MAGWNNPLPIGQSVRDSAGRTGVVSRALVEKVSYGNTSAACAQKKLVAVSGVQSCERQLCLGTTVPQPLRDPL